MRDYVIEIIRSVDDKMRNTFHPFPGIETDAIHQGHDPNDTPGVGRPIVCPISLSTTFLQHHPGEGKYDYSRGNNYTREALETCLAKIEKGDAGITFGSGLAAINAVCQLLSNGDHFVCFDDLYGGTGRLFRQVTVKMGVNYTAVDMRDIEAFKKTLRKETKMVWIETPSNPLMRLVDIQAIVREAKAFNKDIFVVVDNTFMSPYFQRPLSLGADIVMHSITKYINGHADVVMGCLVLHDRPELTKQLRFLQFAAGAVPSAFDCYLTLRGIRTLGVRMKQHMKNGLTIAKFLDEHPKVDRVLHPGLESHPQHELAQKQMIGYSGMISVYLKGTSEQTINFVKGLKVFYLAESLGGFESLVEIPSIMTHASVPPEIRKEVGITDNMVRLSVGLEDVVELCMDLDQSLRANF